MRYRLSQWLYGVEIWFRHFRLWLTGADRYLSLIEDWIEAKDYKEAQRLLNEFRSKFGDMADSVRLQARLDVFKILHKE